MYHRLRKDLLKEQIKILICNKINSDLYSYYKRIFRYSMQIKENFNKKAITSVSWLLILLILIIVADFYGSLCLKSI